MEPYILTQADIDDLLSRGFDMRGVSEGTEAMPAEVQALGMAAPAAAPADQGMSPVQMEYSASRAAGVAPENAPQEDPVAAMGGMPAATAAPAIAAPAVAAAPTAAYGGANMMDLLSQPISQDPFENLSRAQRTMIGFAALKDAGLALQGKEGGAVQNVMADITARADMERKRRSALARQQMMTNLMGGGGMAAGAGALDTPEAIRGRIQQLTQFAMMNPSMAAGLAPEIQRLQGEAERIGGVLKEVANKEMMIGQIDALLFDPALSSALAFEGFLRRPISDFGLDDDVARVKGRIEQIKGGAFLQAFESLKGGGQITELEGQKAEQAQSRLSTAQSEEDFRDALQEYKFYIDQGVRRLRGERIPEDTLYGTGGPAADPLGIR